MAQNIFKNLTFYLTGKFEEKTGANASGKGQLQENNSWKYLELISYIIS